MRILLDNNVDKRFSRLLFGHEVEHCRDLGWAQLTNGNLLSTAESNGFEVLLTCDKQMRHQQNFSKRSIALVTLNTLKAEFSDIQVLAPEVLRVLLTIEAGQIVIVNP